MNIILRFSCLRLRYYYKIRLTNRYADVVIQILLGTRRVLLKLIRRIQMIARIWDLLMKRSVTSRSSSYSGEFSDEMRQRDTP